MIDLLLTHYNYWIVMLLMMIGFYAIVTSGNLFKKLIGLSIFQTSVLLFYISMAKIHNSEVPILKAGSELYSNPLPHVLMLTAIVVGVAVLAVGLAIVVRIKEAYGTIEEDDILDINAGERE